MAKAACISRIRAQAATLERHLRMLISRNIDRGQEQTGVRAPMGTATMHLSAIYRSDAVCFASLYHTEGTGDTAVLL